MNQELLQLLLSSGLDALLVAICINVGTFLLKKPIKYAAAKSADSARITKYITLIPLVLGFAFALLYRLIAAHTLAFNRAFFTLWISGTSLSLALYAVYEKFFPCKKQDKLFEDGMIYDCYRLLESLSGISDDACLKSLAKLVADRCHEMEQEGSRDEERLAAVLRGLIPDQSLEAVSKAMLTKLCGAQDEAAEACEAQTAAQDKPSDKQRIVLKGTDA